MPSSSPRFVLPFLFFPFLCYSLNETLPFLTYCSGDNFTSHSLYEANLRRLLSFLVASTPISSSFYAISTFTNSSSQQVFGLAHCRPDSSASLCASCLNQSAAMATTDSISGCGKRKSAALRYDLCLLRYSDQSFFGVVEDRILVHSRGEVNNASLVLNLEANELIKGELIEQAASSTTKFAAGNTIGGGDSRNIYAMAWCAMDLERTSACAQCLGAAMDAMVPGKERGRVAAVSCEVRYATSQFFSTVSFSRARNAPPPEPPETVAPNGLPVTEEGEYI